MIAKMCYGIRKHHWILVLVSLLALVLLCDLHLYRDRYDIDTGFGFKHPILWRYQKNVRSGSHQVISSFGLHQDQVSILLYQGGSELVSLHISKITIDSVIVAQADALQTSKPGLEVIEPVTIIPESDGTIATALFRNTDSQNIRLTVIYLGRGIYGVAKTYYGTNDKLNQEADAVVSSMYYSVYPTNLR